MDDDSRSLDLKQILPQQFRERLSEAETRVLRAATNGEWAVCGSSPDDDVKSNDPAHDQSWGEERAIRAGLLRWLCMDTEAQKRVDPRGVHIYAAKIVDQLDLSHLTVPFPLTLKRCHLIDETSMEFIKIPALCLTGTRVGSLEANDVEVRGSVLLDGGFSSQGEVNLSGAKIGHDLNCEKGSFRNPGGPALTVDQAFIGAAVYLTNGFSAAGVVNLYGARIGSLDCSGSRFDNPRGSALHAETAEIQGSVFFADGFSSYGEVGLSATKIGGDLSCYQGSFNNPGGTALKADRAVVGGGRLSHWQFLGGGQGQFKRGPTPRQSGLHWRPFK